MLFFLTSSKKAFAFFALFCFSKKAFAFFALFCFFGLHHNFPACDLAFFIVSCFFFSLSN